MTYYEELGLSPLATEAEVKRSYKRLTLLLHPDQHQDPEIRALANVQMKRLNEIASILEDPEQRRIYDKQLLGVTHNVRQLVPQSPLVWLRNNRGWLLVSISFLLFLTSALLIPKFDSERPVARAESKAPRPTPAKLIAEPPVLVPKIQTRETTASKIRAAHAGPTPARRSLAGPAKPETQPEQVEFSPASPLTLGAAALPAPPPPLVVTPHNPVASNATPEVSNLTGKWVFTPGPMDLQDSTKFPAEYVELTILVADERLRGSYRSRYKLSDHALSPYANFKFDGPANGTSFVWRGDAGAQGHVALRLQSRDTLQVNWFATKMGSELSLGSGSATVYRFR